MQYFSFPFYENGTTCNILLCPKCYIGMYLMDRFGKFDFFNPKLLSKKNTPTLKKLMPWQVYVKCSNRVYFVECTRHQACLQSLLSCFSSYRLSKHRRIECCFESDPLNFYIVNQKKKKKKIASTSFFIQNTKSYLR